MIGDKFKRTKILATVGPASDSKETIKKLIEAGANGFRFNFSHGEYEERIAQTAWIREASEEHGRPVAILQDLQGPKIRLGDIGDELYRVSQGDEMVLEHAVDHREGNILPVQYNLASKVAVGQPLFLFDGKVRATIIEILSETAIKIRAENSGELMSRKGINLPDTDFAGDILTEKDLRDIEFGATEDYDYVSLSFVQSEDDINNLRQILVGFGSDARIIAKIETKSAIDPERLEAIVMASDGVMVARGDLAVEAGAEVVPIVQRRVISLCRKHSKLSIVATQMMASMVNSPEPTRAEVSDVATATIQGTDVVMLSDETANGDYPVEAVASMKKIIIYTQENWPLNEAGEKVVRSGREGLDAIAKSATELAETIRVENIVAETSTGATAESLSACRPTVPILAVTSEKRTAQQLALSYATRSFVFPDGEKAGLRLVKQLFDQGFFGEKRRITSVIVSGRHPGLPGSTDTIRVRVIE